MTIQDVISEVTEELEKIVSAQTVIGEPIHLRKNFNSGDEIICRLCQRRI